MTPFKLKMDLELSSTFSLVSLDILQKCLMRAKHKVEVKLLKNSVVSSFLPLLPTYSSLLLL